jgi:hypothetical protein
MFHHLGGLAKRIMPLQDQVRFNWRSRHRNTHLFVAAFAATRAFMLTACQLTILNTINILN